VVNFLNSAKCPFADDIPNYFHLGDDMVFARSPWVPVIIEGVRVPMLLDTGAEVTILSRLPASPLSGTRSRRRDP